MTLKTCEECLHKAVCPNCNDFDDVLNIKDYCPNFLDKSALEKQIPKKPLNITLEYDGYYGDCPNCKNVVAEYKNLQYCTYCGKALDWGDGE